MWKAALIPLMLVGCATQNETETITIPSQKWAKAGGTVDAATADSAGCRVQAMSITGVGTPQMRAIYAACMQSKGWALVK